jgi:hypothetical protein
MMNWERNKKVGCYTLALYKEFRPLDDTAYNQSIIPISTFTEAMTEKKNPEERVSIG